MFRIKNIAIVLLLIVMLLGCENESDDPVASAGNRSVKIVKIEADFVSIKLGGVSKLKAIVDNPDEADLFFEWKSSANGLLVEALQENARFIGIATGEATVTCTVKDDKGSSTSETVKINISAPEITATLNSITPNIINPGVGQPVTFLVGYNNPKGEQIAFFWSLSSGGSIVGSNFASLTYLPKALGTHIIGVTLKSLTTGSTSSKSTSIEVVDTPNKAPIIKSVVSDKDTVALNQPAKITCNAEDPNGDVLNYGWSLESGFPNFVTLTQDADKRSVIFKAQLNGVYYIRISVTDSSGYLDFTNKKIVVK